MIRCRIKEGYNRAGLEGEYFGKYQINGICWAVILFDHKDDCLDNRVESEKRFLTRETHKEIHQGV